MTDDPLDRPLKRRLRTTMVGVVGIGAILLSLPARDSALPAAPPHGAPFAWNQDSLWHALEAQYVALRGSGCNDGEGPRGIADVNRRLDAIAAVNLLPADAAFDSLEQTFFALGPIAAACPGSLHD